MRAVAATRAPVFLLAAWLVGACHSKQTVQRCRACFVDSPSDCATYEGFCYGPYSHSMPASTPDEAKESAASSACTLRYGGVIPPSGPQPGCALGLSYTDADRKASLTHFRFECTAFEKKCP
jgi:hypothetical protein